MGAPWWAASAVGAMLGALGSGWMFLHKFDLRLFRLELELKNVQRTLASVTRVSLVDDSSGEARVA